MPVTIKHYDSFAGDDFVVPEGQIWNITEVDVIGEYSEPPVQPDSFHVFFYADSGALPGTLVASRLANPYSGFIDFVIFRESTSAAAPAPGYGIQVARLAGLPKEILDRAKEILAHLEKNGR